MLLVSLQILLVIRFEFYYVSEVNWSIISTQSNLIEYAIIVDNILNLLIKILFHENKDSSKMQHIY